jgi:hypothetical protein
MDEAIAIQRRIVEAERSLASSHPVADVKRSLRAQLKEDERLLRELETLGEPLGATGKEEEVATSLGELLSTTTESAGEAESEAYEAHAVLLTLKRKQMDSGPAMVKIARDRKDAELRDAATRFERTHRASAKELATSLAEFARRIAAA